MVDSPVVDDDIFLIEGKLTNGCAIVLVKYESRRQPLVNNIFVFYFFIPIFYERQRDLGLGS